MSRVTELAEAEASAVEAEEEAAAEEDAATAETEPDPTPEPEPIDERDLKAMARELDRHHAALAKIMGADFEQLHECPTCAGMVPGFVLEDPNPLDQFKAAPDKRRCEACDGYGQVQSGARNANALVMCMGCAGNGYVTIQTAAVQSYVPDVNGQTVVPPGYLPPSAEAAPPSDAWGRPLGHPHYGMHPSTIGV